MKSIVIHSGGPYGGHYYAYIKDDLGEGNWNLHMPAVFAKDPVEKDNRPAHIKQKEADEKKKKEAAE